jgi:hypothetical protein
MASKTTILMQEMGELKRFPEFLPREDMQNWRYLYAPGVLNSLAVYFSKTLPELRCAKFRLRATDIVETRDLDENTLIDLDSEGNPASSSPSAPARLRIPAFSYEQIPA